MDREQRIEQLEARIAELSAEVRALRVSDSDTAVIPGDEPDPRSSRRRLLQLAGAAAAGTAAAMSTRSDRVAADDGDPVRASQTVSTTAASTTPTVVEFTNTLSPKVTYGGNDVAANMFLVRDVPNASSFNPDGSASFPAAIAGYSFRTVANGVYGYTQQQGSGVVGFGAVAGSVGVLASGVTANLELRSAGHSAALPKRPASPRSSRVRRRRRRVGVHHCWLAGNVAEARRTVDLWRVPRTGSRRACTTRARRNPSMGRSSAATTAPSRWPTSATSTTGAVTTADFVPVGATAVAANITVVSLSGGWFLTVQPGRRHHRQGASTINWTRAGPGARQRRDPQR